MVTIKKITVYPLFDYYSVSDNNFINNEFQHYNILFGFESKTKYLDLIKLN